MSSVPPVAAASGGNVWPISMDDVREVRRRIAPFLSPTPLRRYASLDDAAGAGVRVWVKHENHNPTNAFKARNAMSILSALPREATRRGVITATRGNHGQGIAWAGGVLDIPVTVYVPLGNNPEKNEAMRGYGADLPRGRRHDFASTVLSLCAAKWQVET